MTMSPRSPHARRLGALLLGLTILSLSLAGCFGKPDGDASQEAPPEAFATFDLYVAPMDAPPELEGAVLSIIVDHIAFLDTETDTWTPLLTQPVTLELILEEGFGEAAWLTTVPLPAGDYSDVELVASSATLTTPEGEEPATIGDDTCYATIPVTAEADEETELTLILDASAALSDGDGGWTFRPALVGGYGGGSEADGEAAIGEPYCVSSA